MEVQPLYKYSDIQNVQNILGQKWGNVREGECFFLAFHIGLRACGLVKLKFDQFKKNRVAVVEKKTGKTRIMSQTDMIKKSIETLRAWYKNQGINPTYLFQATGNRVGKQIKPINQRYYYKKINDAAEALGIDHNIGTHTARKSFGYHLYKRTGNLAIVQELLNHSNPKETRRYIGITQQIVEEAVTSLDFSKPCEG